MAAEPAFSTSLAVNEQRFRTLLGQQKGAIFRRLSLPGPPAGQGGEVLLIFFEAQLDQAHLELAVVRPLLEGEVTPAEVPARITASTTPMKSAEQAVAFVYRGKALLLVDGSPDVYALELANPPHRQITPPETESGFMGPRESFSELLVINLAMLRRRYPGEELRIDSLWIGQSAKLEMAVVYLDGRPKKQVLTEVRKRLSQVTADGIQDVAELTEALTDSPITLFPTVLVTERPDMAMQYLKGGRIAILLDNSPRALVVPILFMSLFTSSDDFYEWRPFVAFLRLLRFLAFGISVPLPAIYVAVTTYHLQALPTQLTLSLLAQREGAPLPPPIEAAVMTVIFELLREAGVRLPKAIGPTVSIVGGLVIGDAAIRSGLTSPAMVLVVSATAVAAFSLPSTTLANAATYYRFFLLFLASTLGFFGLMVGYLALLANLAATTSLGVPYMTPVMPLRIKYLVGALGLNPRPPAGTGATPSPNMINEAADFQEESR